MSSGVISLSPQEPDSASSGDAAFLNSHHTGHVRASYDGHQAILAPVSVYHSANAEEDFAMLPEWEHHHQTSVGDGLADERGFETEENDPLIYSPSMDVHNPLRPSPEAVAETPKALNPLQSSFVHKQHPQLQQSSPSKHPASVSLSATTSIEDRMSHVLNAAEEAGFENFDLAVTSYYTTSFEEGTLPRCSQATSRSRRLRQLLTDLHESSKTWVGREAQGYHEERMAGMERMLGEEVARLAYQGLQGSDSEAKKRAFIADTIRQLLQDETSSSLWKRDKRYLREQVREIIVLNDFPFLCLP